MKKIYLIIGLCMLFLSFTNKTFAVDENTLSTDEIIENQEANFGIRDFLKETENFLPNFMEDIDITKLFNETIKGNIDNKILIKKIFSLFGEELTNTLKILINILVIVLIHSILKSITDGLENGEISKIVYYVQYILIVTIIMANFSDILKNVTETIENLVGFARLLIPLLITLMVYTGSITTTAVIEPILLFLIEFIANIIKTLVIPVISIITVLIIVSKITDRIQISKIGDFLKSTIVWALGIVLTLFVGVVSLEGSLTSSIDGITAKTAKATVSSLIPIVGKILGDGVDAILRVWSNFKKCGWNSRSINNCRNMYNANNKTWNFKYNVFFSIWNNRTCCRQ